MCKQTKKKETAHRASFDYNYNYNYTISLSCIDR